MSKVRSVCAVVSRPPVGNRAALEILRFSLALLAGDIEYSLVLAEDGVFHALRELPPHTHHGRQTTRRLLEDSIDFDVQVYVVEEDLAPRGLRAEDLIPSVNVVPAQQVVGLVRRADSTYYL